jgi:hypothetical protein
MTIVRLALALTVVNIVLLLVALPQAGPADAQGTPAVLRGRVLELVDERSQIRARLNVESSGAVVLRLLDEQGTIRVKLGADKEGSGLLLGASGSLLRDRVIVPDLWAWPTAPKRS